MNRYNNNRYPEVYVLCKSWREVKDGLLGTEKEIIVGDNQEPVRVEKHFFYKTKEDEPVIKVTEISRAKGKIEVAIPVAMQTQHVTRTIPLDDIVDPAKLAYEIF